jgi:hypothetical protein
VIVTYSDGEASGNQVFKDRAKAKHLLAGKRSRQSVVKKALLESLFGNSTNEAGILKYSDAKS